MKKSIVIVLAFIFASAIMFSCKTHEKCAAYSKIDAGKSLVDKNKINS